MILTHGPSLVSAEHADTVSLTGLTLDGGGEPLPADRALVHFDDVKALRISDCQIAGAGGNGVTLDNCDGEVTHNTITGAADNALYCNDSRGLLIAANIHCQVRQRRYPGLAKRQAPRRQPDRRQLDRGHERTRRR